ncbi:MAG: TolC family protein [Salinivirgaceae bacterium]|nr:TolC family protein [Salinivirgaceae bacterium]
MKNLFKTILIGIYCLSVLSVQAQESMVLSLDSAINYATIHNKTLMNSKFAIDKSSQKIKETISQGLPQINASIDYSNFLGAEASLQLNPAAPPAVIEFSPTSNFKLSASQLIFSGGYYVGIQLSKLAKTITEQSYQKDELNVKEQTTQSYYMVLASERILNTLKENKTNVQVIYEKTKNLANAGMIEQTDAKKLSIMVNSIDNAIKSSERQVEMAYNLLRLQLGLETDQLIKLSSGLDDIVQQYINQLASIEVFNIQNNIDFKLLTIQGDIAKKSIQLTKASNLPSLVAFYSYTEKIKKPAFDMTPKNVLGLTLNIPIFSGGQRYSQLNQAKIDYNISENSKELLSDQLSIQEKQLRYNYNNFLEQYLNQKTNVDVAKEVLDKMDLKYQQGVVSILELTSANNDYLSAESNYTNILLQLLNAELALRKINSNL